jgi:hypothetical protein
MPKVFSNVVSVAIILLLLISNSTGQTGRAKSEIRALPQFDSAQYHQVLNIIFPRVDRDFSDPSRKYSLTLRISPSFEPESQINIVKKEGGIEVVKFTAKQNVFHQIGEILERKGIEELREKHIAEIAKMISVSKKVIRNPDIRLKSVIDQYSGLRFSPEFGTGSYFEGVTYELWYEALENSAYFNLSPAVGKKLTDNPLIHWMDDVWKATEQFTNSKTR